MVTDSLVRLRFLIHEHREGASVLADFSLKIRSGFMWLRLLRVSIYRLLLEVMVDLSFRLGTIRLGWQVVRSLFLVMFCHGILGLWSSSETVLLLWRANKPCTPAKLNRFVSAGFSEELSPRSS